MVFMKTKSKLLLLLILSGMTARAEEDMTFERWNEFQSEGDGDHQKKSTPVVRSFGYEVTYPTTATEYSAAYDLNAKARANFDLGLNWEFPVYSQAQFYIWRQRIAFFLGGRQYL